jgi:transcriptional regulator with XRE-family HTH domain
VTEATAGARLKALRKQIGLTQAEFADRLAVSRPLIGKIENGDTVFTESNIRLVCFTFHCSETWLRSGAGEMFEDGDEADLSEEDKDALALSRKLNKDNRSDWLNYGRKLYRLQEFLAAQSAAAPKETKVTVIALGEKAADASSRS